MSVRMIALLAATLSTGVYANPTSHTEADHQVESPSYQGEELEQNKEERRTYYRNHMLQGDRPVMAISSHTNASLDRQVKPEMGHSH